jgi:hypothetical protein
MMTNKHRKTRKNILGEYQIHVLKEILWKHKLYEKQRKHELKYEIKNPIEI